MTSSADRRRRLTAARRSTTDVLEATSDSHIQLSEDQATASAITARSAAAEVEPFPVYPPLRVFPSTTLSTSLAYDMLATAALSTLRRAVPFAALLPPSPPPYDVISAAAAALLRPQFVAPPLTSWSLRRPQLDRGDGVLDLVRAPRSDEHRDADDRRSTDHIKHSSPCNGDANSDQLLMVSPRPRGCVWRPY